jgi:hypothetical protein
VRRAELAVLEHARWNRQVKALQIAREHALTCIDITAIEHFGTYLAHADSDGLL